MNNCYLRVVIAIINGSVIGTINDGSVRTFKLHLCKLHSTEVELPNIAKILSYNYHD
jgi:hypothetical protein